MAAATAKVQTDESGYQVDALQYAASEELQNDEEFKAAIEQRRREINKEEEAKGAESDKEAVMAADEKDDQTPTEHTSPVDQTQQLAPLKFDEQNFVLKAAATQLVSTFILLYYLLPFYKKGSDWWLEGTKAFLGGAFDLPRLQLQFSLSFGWPAFSQPRLGWQLAVGCLLVALQLLFRAVKWALRHSHSVLRMPSAEPGPWERRAVEAFAVCSWRLFGGVADTSKAALEETMGWWGVAWNFVVLKKGA